jgi:hypothetical protein
LTAGRADGGGLRLTQATPPRFEVRLRRSDDRPDASSARRRLVTGQERGSRQPTPSQLATSIFGFSVQPGELSATEPSAQVRLLPGYGPWVIGPGIAASAASASAITTAGIAGLVVGALSMAAGEFVSVSSQRDAEQADLRLETREPHDDPDGELRELTVIYERRGFDPALAGEAALP